MLNKFDSFISIIKLEPEQVRNKFLVSRVKEFHSRESYTDKEISFFCFTIIEVVTDSVRDTIYPFIESRNLGYELEKELITALVDKAYWHTWITLLVCGGIDEKFFERVEEDIKEFKAKVTSLWFQRIEETVRKADAREALKYINEVMFQVKSIERRCNVLGQEVSQELPHLKGFFSDCYEYLTTKIQLEGLSFKTSCDRSIRQAGLSSLDSVSESLLSGTSGTGDTREPTHREEAFAYSYKEAVKLVKPLSREEMRKHGGKGREKAFDSINCRSKTYKPAREEELVKVIEMLKDYPAAQRAAINDLDRLQNS